MPIKLDRPSPVSGGPLPGASPTKFSSALQYSKSGSTKHETPSQNPTPCFRAVRPVSSYLPIVDEPICTLKIELNGNRIEQLKIFENDDPYEIVHRFGEEFELSKNARRKLLENIQEQMVQMDDDD